MLNCKRRQLFLVITQLVIPKHNHISSNTSFLIQPVSLFPACWHLVLQRHPSVVPFLVYIKSEVKHVERMAVRAKYMTLVRQAVGG